MVEISLLGPDWTLLTAFSERQLLKWKELAASKDTEELGWDLDDPALPHSGPSTGSQILVLLLSLWSLYTLLCLFYPEHIQVVMCRSWYHWRARTDLSIPSICTKTSFVKGFISGALTFVACVPDCFCLNELLLPNKLSQDTQYVGLVFHSYFPAFSLTSWICEGTVDRNCPPWPDMMITVCKSCLTSGSPDKEPGAAAEN